MVDRALDTKDKLLESGHKTNPILSTPLSYPTLLGNKGGEKKKKARLSRRHKGHLPPKRGKGGEGEEIKYRNAYSVFFFFFVLFVFCPCYRKQRFPLPSFNPVTKVFFLVFADRE